MRKLLALCVSAALVSGIGGSALAFSDVTEDSPYAEAVAVLAENEITTGRSNDVFDPEDSLTTAQLVTFLGRIAGQDLPPVAEGIVDDGWSGSYMSWALAHGLIDETFEQYAPLDAESVNAVLAAFCAMQEIEAVTVEAADAAVTRGEAAIALAALVEADAEEPSETEEPAETEEPSEAEKPAETEEPSEAEEPAETEEPSEAEKPAETEEPSETEEPTETEEPSEAEKPAETEEPTETEEPSEAENPAETEEPSEAEEPAETEEPSETEEPTETEEPSEAEEPAETEEPSETEEPAENEDAVKIADVKYTTIAAGQDWGPAIYKVVLNLGVALDAESVSAEKFAASSVRTVPGFDYEKMEATEPAPQTVERTVTDAYVCDENGVKAEEGTYVAVEMEISPAASDAANPFFYDGSLNVPVAHTYEIALAEGEILTDAEGKAVTFEATTAEGFENAVVEVADDFTKDEFTWKAEDAEEDDEGITLTYASWMPQEEAEEASTPLIIWLHGAGEGGTDPVVALVGNKVVNLASEDIQKHFGETGAAILVPQAPTFWMDNGEGEYLTAEDESGRSIYTDALMALIEKFVADHPEIDADRIYIGGCSNGGYMTVNMITEFPAYFAAAYPVCEAYDAAWMTDEMVEAIKDLPIWITAAKNDNIVKIFEGEADAENPMAYNLKLDDDGSAIALDNFSNNLYNRLVDAGAEKVYYSLFDDVRDMTGLYNGADGEPYQYQGHWSWLYVLNDQCVETIEDEEVTIFQWLAGQGK